MPDFSGAALFANLLVSSIGFVGFISGRRQGLWKRMFLGLALMAFPYFVGSTAVLVAIGTTGTAALFLVRD